MALYSKVVQSDGSWRLLDKDGNPIGRVWATAHIDRILRDGTLAEAVRDAIAAGGTVSNRRQAVRAAIAAWATAGGHSVDFSALTHSLNNDAGVEDGNRHLYLSGNEFGYLHGVDLPRDLRLARLVRLAEELFSGEALSTSGARNAALDAALTRFTDDGGLNGAELRG